MTGRFTQYTPEGLLKAVVIVAIYINEAVPCRGTASLIKK